jgi:MFS transporter, DHA2 family, multidrug resistance protein
VVAPVLGPTVGGWITDNYSWRWVFFINIPIGVIATFAVLSLVEDPPWARAKSRVSTDYIGIGLIALTFAAFQIMLDRGEDDDWFSSPFINSLAVIAAVGLASAIAWLLYARRPVVDLRVFRDRNFTLGCVAIGSFAVLLYGSAVVVPQLAQVHLGYTALLAGLVMSPGAICVIFLIPLLNLILPRVQTRFVLTFGFLVLGCSMLYSRTLTPDINFGHLMFMRITQTLGIGFLFVPLSILAYGTLPRDLQQDATALFTMFRNVLGSVGISVTTAMITSRTQTHMAYLGYHTSHTNPNFGAVLSQLTRAIQGLGASAAVASQRAFGQAYQTLISQASFLAYKDVFLYCALLAFAFTPLTFFFSGVKKAGGPPGAH